MFYMTYARSRPDDIVPYAEENNIGLMTNAAHRYSTNTNRFLNLWHYNTPHIVDSGGYNVQANHGEYPWTVRDYHRWLSGHSEWFDWAAVMDYACEERFDDLHTVEERIQKTITNTIRHFDLDPEYDVRPVLQGRSISEYVDCYDRLVDHGIPVGRVGLGTVCRISSEKEIVTTETNIREACKHVEEIHGFGVKVQAFKHGATFDSADSQAWVYNPSNGKVVYDGWNRLIERDMKNDSRRRTVESFRHYYQYASRLKQKANGGGQLALFPPESGL